MLCNLNSITNRVNEDTLQRIKPLVAGITDSLGIPFTEPSGHQAPSSGAVPTEYPSAEATVMPAASDSGEGRRAVHAGSSGTVGEPVRRFSFEQVLVNTVVGFKKRRGAWYVNGGAKEGDVLVGRRRRRGFRVLIQWPCFANCSTASLQMVCSRFATEFSVCFSLFSV